MFSTKSVLPIVLPVFESRLEIIPLIIPGKPQTRVRDYFYFCFCSITPGRKETTLGPAESMRGCAGATAQEACRYCMFVLVLACSIAHCRNVSRLFLPESALGIQQHPEHEMVALTVKCTALELQIRLAGLVHGVSYDLAIVLTQNSNVFPKYVHKNLTVAPDAPTHVARLPWPTGTREGIGMKIVSSVYDGFPGLTQEEALLTHGTKMCLPSFARNRNLIQTSPETESTLEQIDDSHVGLEVLLLFPPHFPSEAYVVTTSNFSIRLLFRCWSPSHSCSEVDQCRKRLHHCARSDKTAYVHIEGKNGLGFTAIASGSITVSWTLFDVPDGDYDMTVRVQMDTSNKADSGQATVFSFSVSTAHPPHGHDLNLTECTPSFPRASATAEDPETWGTAAHVVDCLVLPCLNGGECLHTESARSVCVCKADYAGDRCEVSLRDWFPPPREHMPANDPGADERTCMRNEPWLRDAKRFSDKLMGIYKTAGDHDGISYYDAYPGIVNGAHPEIFENQILDTGLGAQLFFASSALIFGMRTGSAVRWTTADPLFTHFGNCGRAGPSDPMFSCFFRPLYDNNGNLCESRGGSVPSKRFYEPLDEFPRLGSFFLMAEVLAVLTQPTTELKMSMRRLKQAIHFREGMLALHIRKGESCFMKWARKPCVSTEEHCVLVRRLLAQYPGISGVFLATDDHATVQEVTALLSDVTTVTWNPHIKRGLGGHRFPIAELIAMGQLDRRYATEGIVLDLMLLAECRYLVGNLESALARAALLLMTSRLGYVPPFISSHQHEA